MIKDLVISHLPTKMWLHSHTVSILFSLSQVCILPLLFPLHCTADEPHFINCGSSTSITTTSGQLFVGDLKSDKDPFSFPGRTAKISADPSESLYQSARVFRKPSSYNFGIKQNGTYFVRLHFCAFTSSLTNAKFNVSTSSGHLLLSDFTPGVNFRNLPIVKEFILTTKQTGFFRLYFHPIPFSSAFVNAIELFSTPSNIMKDSVQYVTHTGYYGDYKDLNSEALETIYRITVGGKEVNTSNDTLWRTWIPDDNFLINMGDAENTHEMSSFVDYSQQATPDDAPPMVYGTAKMLNTTLSSRIIPNLTWQFNVSRDTKYFVRAHFCDIISPASTPDSFILYINGKFSQVIAPFDITDGNGIPFFKGYVAESGDLAYMNISIGPNNEGYDRRYLFLNGLEIMQVRNEIIHEPQVDNNHSRLAVIISLVTSGAFLMVILATIVACLLKRRRKKHKIAFERENFPLYDATTSHTLSVENFQLSLKIPFVEIQRVTNNFDVNLIIGEGGFGKVYEGTLRSGLKVAVKRGSLEHGQGLEEFQTEIMILSKIRHRHLVSLIGYCCENGEMILVYEFMEKGTLRYHLYDSKKSSTSSTEGGVLSWKQRLEICIGAAKGIKYLHTGTNKRIIHRDVKSTNILLDENYDAKVADFGLSRSGYLEQTHVSISDVKGTLGYLDPEYVISLQLTEKSDVYAFGMVLLEALCARPVIDHSLRKDQVNIDEWAMSCYEKGELETIIDPMIASEMNANSMKKFWEIAERCLKRNATQRPPMSDVCWGLEYALQLQKAADARVTSEDTMTSYASLNMPLTDIQCFFSQSIADDNYSDEEFRIDSGQSTLS